MAPNPLTRDRKESEGTRTPLLQAAFFAALFFLGSADKVFATRLFGMNFRWAQLLIIVGVLATLPSFIRRLASDNARPPPRLVPIVAAWSAFFGCYALSAILSPAPSQTLVKLCWGIFNIGGAIVLCLHAGRQSLAAVRTGLALACIGISTVIWIDALGLYWFLGDAPLLGLAQASAFEDRILLRPHAFYYEPSYAGAWLGLAIPATLLALDALPLWVRSVAGGVSASAAVLATSRTGLLSVAAAFFLIGLFSLIRRETKLLKTTLGSLGVAVVATAIFFVPSSTHSFSGLLTKQLGFEATLKRLQPSEDDVLRALTAQNSRGDQAGGGGDDEILPPFSPENEQQSEPMQPLDAGLEPVRPLDVQTQPIQPVAGQPELQPVPYRPPNTSEGYRIQSYLRALEIWKRHPVLGAGTSLDPDGESFIRPIAINTWLEVLVESGLVGFLAFVFALAVSIRSALSGASSRAIILVSAALFAHFVINLNLTQTFPRLDYWLVFFAALSLTSATRPAAASDSIQAPEQAEETNRPSVSLA